jgi:hypothetical protein
VQTHANATKLPLTGATESESHLRRHITVDTFTQCRVVSRCGPRKRRCLPRLKMSSEEVGEQGLEYGWVDRCEWRTVVLSQLRCASGHLMSALQRGPAVYCSSKKQRAAWPVRAARFDLCHKYICICICICATLGAMVSAGACCPCTATTAPENRRGHRARGRKGARRVCPSARLRYRPRVPRCVNC